MEIFGFQRRKNYLNGGNHYQQYDDDHDDDSIQFSYGKFHNDLLSVSNAITPVTQTAIAAVSTPISILTTETATTTTTAATAAIRNNYNKKSSSLLQSKKFINDNNTNSIKFDKRLRTVLICTVIILIIYKITIFSLSYAEKVKISENLKNLFSYILKQMENVFATLLFTNETKSSDTNQQNIIYSRTISLLCGIGFSIFSVLIVYMDSYLPGIYPPSPFTSESNLSYSQQKSNPWHIGYMTAIASGVVVSFLMYYDF